MSTSLLVIIVGMTVGVGMIIVSCRVYLRKRAFDLGGLTLTLIGFAFVTLSIWQSIRISVTPGGGLEANFERIEQKLEEGFQKQEALINEVAQAVQTLDLQQLSLHEPSGLTRTHLATANPLVLAVDDEQRGIFMLEGTETINVHGPIHFARFEEFEGKDPDDLEGICFNGSRYFAITSHRRLGADRKRERRLIRFMITADWRTAGYTIPVKSEDIRDLSDPIKQFLKKHGIILDLNKWTRKFIDDRHPYVFEIEGLACEGDRIFLGLKWPMHQESALLMEYDWAQNVFVGDLVRLDLGRKSITGMTYHLGRNLLLVAANPPEKVYDQDEPEVAERYFGSSDIYVFRLRPASQKVALIAKLTNHSRRGAKLEGLAIVDKDLWLAYDGHKPAIIKKRLRTLQIGF